MQDVGSANAVLERLNACLRPEISAVESYRHAIDRLRDPRLRDALRGLLRAHQERVDLLRARILELGGPPLQGGAPWPALPGRADGGGASDGTGPMLAALQIGEDDAFAAYRSQLTDLDTQSRVLIRRRLLPEQERACRAIAHLQQRVPA
jgi:hypothetical protein